MKKIAQLESISAGPDYSALASPILKKLNNNFCSKCGEKFNAAEAKFCGGCGQSR